MGLDNGCLGETRNEAAVTTIMVTEQWLAPKRFPFSVHVLSCRKGQKERKELGHTFPGFAMPKMTLPFHVSIP